MSNEEILALLADVIKYLDYDLYKCIFLETDSWSEKDKLHLVDIWHKHTVNKLILDTRNSHMKQVDIKENNYFWIT